MTLRALLFDVDGTLADTEETHRRAFNAAFHQVGLPFQWEPAEYEALLEVPGGKERLAHYFAHLDASPAERERLATLIPLIHRRKTACFSELVASGELPLRPGVARLIGEASRAGLRLGIATTTTPENVAVLLESTLGPGADGLFAVTVCGDMVAAKKPAPDAYLQALSALGVSAADALAFEDSAPGVRAAKAAGLPTVVTPTRWTRKQDLAAADLRLAHLGDPSTPLPKVYPAIGSATYLTLERLVSLHASWTQKPGRRSTC